LSALGLSLKNVILVDNAPVSYSLQPQNGIPIKTWIDDQNDKELLNLLPVLEYLSHAEDVRYEIRKLGISEHKGFLYAQQIIGIIKTVENTAPASKKSYEATPKSTENPKTLTRVSTAFKQLKMPNNPEIKTNSHYDLIIESKRISQGRKSHQHIYDTPMAKFCTPKSSVKNLHTASVTGENTPKFLIPQSATSLSKYMKIGNQKLPDEIKNFAKAYYGNIISKSSLKNTNIVKNAVTLLSKNQAFNQENVNSRAIKLHKKSDSINGNSSPSISIIRPETALAKSVVPKYNSRCVQEQNFIKQVKFLESMKQKRLSTATIVNRKTGFNIRVRYIKK